MSDPARRRRVVGRVCIGLGVLAILVGVLRMNARALGGPPEHTRDFGQRRTDRQVRSAVHEGFPEFLVCALGGFGLIVFGAYRAKGPSGS